MIESLLRQLGFSDKEITVYLTVLKYAQILPTDVAKLTGLQRSTVYSVARELEQKGALREITRQGHIYFSSTNPHELMQLVTRGEARLEETRRTVSAAITELQTYTRDARLPVPHVTTVVEEDILPFLHARMELWNNSSLAFDATWWGFQDHTFATAFESWIDTFWKTAPAKLHLKLFSNTSPIEEKIHKKNYARREIRFWEGDSFTGTTWVIGAYVVMIVTDRRPMYLIELHDQTLARNHATVFEKMWRQGT